MTDIERKLLEMVGASEEDTQPKDKVGNLAETVDDIILLMAEIIGGE